MIPEIELTKKYNELPLPSVSDSLNVFYLQLN
jgi:hypothetical protein